MSFGIETLNREVFTSSVGETDSNSDSSELLAKLFSPARRRRGFYHGRRNRRILNSFPRVELPRLFHKRESVSGINRFSKKNDSST